MVNKVIELSENLGIKVNIEKIEIQHRGRTHNDFNIIIKKQSLKQTALFIWEETSVQRRGGPSYIIYICIQTNTYMHIQKTMHTYTIYTVHTHLCIYKYIHIHAQIQIHTNSKTHIHTHIHKYTHIEQTQVCN